MYRCRNRCCICDNHMWSQRHQLLCQLDMRSKSALAQRTSSRMLRPSCHPASSKDFRRRPSRVCPTGSPHQHRNSLHFTFSITNYGQKCRHPADQRDELPPFHEITPSKCSRQSIKAHGLAFRQRDVIHVSLESNRESSSARAMSGLPPRANVSLVSDHFWSGPQAAIRRLAGVAPCDSRRSQSLRPPESDRFQMVG
jgi:hypothetical protein